MTRSESNGPAMLTVLRRQLRQAGWTAPRLAAELGAGEATVKRWLAGKGLTIDRLERLAGLVSLTLGDLAREAEEMGAELAPELTLAQERALSRNIFLSFLFLAILNGVPVDEIAADFEVPAGTMEAALARLERLALIDRLRSGRVRPLVDRALVFRKLPLRSLFEQHMKPAFFELDYAAPDTLYTSEVLKLSPRGVAQLAEVMERQRAEMLELADRDRQAGLPGRDWYGILSVARALDMEALRANGIPALGEAIGVAEAKGAGR